MDANKLAKVTPTQLRVTDIPTPNQKFDYISQGTYIEDASYEADLSRVYWIAWTTEGGFMARDLRIERFYEIIVLGEGKGCEIRTWECQGGMLARFVRYYYRDVLQTKFAV